MTLVAHTVFEGWVAEKFDCKAMDFWELETNTDKVSTKAIFTKVFCFKHDNT